jgi:hypothetical protein
MIELQIESRQILLSPLEQSLAKAAASRHALRLQLQSQLSPRLPSYSPAPSILLQDVTLKAMIHKFSEQIVYHPLEEIRAWFNYSGGLFLEPGYPPLFYARSKSQEISPNKSAIAGVGEGVAGFLAQRLYRCRKLARPIHDYPDLVLEGNGKTYLVESKATTEPVSVMQRTIDEELLRMAAYVSVCAELDTRPVVGLLIGTALVSEVDYYCCVSEVLL